MSRPYLGAESIPDTQRCQAWLTQMQHGRIATQLLAKHFDQDGNTPMSGVVYRLPLFMPQTNISVSWDVPLAGVVSHGEAVTATWRANDRITGELSGTVVFGGTLCGLEDMSPGVTAFTSPARLHHALKQIICTGDVASWQLTNDFRPFISMLVKRVSYQVAHEIGINGEHDHRTGVVDRVEIEEITDTYLLGNGTERGLFYKLLCRASSAELGDQSKVGDRITYIARNARRDAEDQLRRRIGDPHTGRLVRRVYHSMGKVVDFAELQEEFARQHPGQKRLMHQRAHSALTVSATPNHMSSSLEEFLEHSHNEPVAGEYL